jgi:hypothetical protein
MKIPNKIGDDLQRETIVKRRPKGGFLTHLLNRRIDLAAFGRKRYNVLQRRQELPSVLGTRR